MIILLLHNLTLNFQRFINVEAEFCSANGYYHNNENINSNQYNFTLSVLLIALVVFVGQQNIQQITQSGIISFSGVMSADETRQTTAQKRSLQYRVNEYFKQMFNAESAKAIDNTRNTAVEQYYYIYDDNGNRIEQTETNGVTEITTYTFDNNDRLTDFVIASGATQSLTTFTYDVRDQLTQILSGGSSIGQFLYDYQGLRIRKQTPTETLRYVYDDQSVLQQTDDAGTTISKYDYGVDKLLSLNHTTEGAQFYLFDVLGSVVNLTKPDGTIQTRTQYDAWGNVRNQIGSSANEFGFTGHEMDEESGLIYMKARYYDSELGSFLNQDAFEGVVDTPPSLHKYLYAYNNPTVFADLDGNQSTEIFETEGEAGERSFGDSASLTNNINSELPRSRQSTAERIAELTQQTEIENNRRFENREQDSLETIEEAKFRKSLNEQTITENDRKPGIKANASGCQSYDVSCQKSFDIENNKAAMTERGEQAFKRGIKGTIEIIVTHYSLKKGGQILNGVKNSLGKAKDKIKDKFFSKKENSKANANANVDNEFKLEGNRKVIPTNDFDKSAQDLAKRINGKSSVRIQGFGNREFDAVSDNFVAQTFGPKVIGKQSAFQSNPKNFLSKSRRNQIRVTLEAAKTTKRKALFEFAGGKPNKSVVEFIERNAKRQGAQFEINIKK